MFNKNTYIKIEILPDGKPFLEVHINKNTDPDEVSDFFNKFLVGEYTKYLLEAILKDTKKQNIAPIGQEICDNIVNFCNQIEISPAKQNRRNPLVDPCQIMSESNNDE